MAFVSSTGLRPCRAAKGTRCARRRTVVCSTKLSAAVAVALAVGSGQVALAAVPETLPEQLFVDDANVVQRANQGYTEKALTKLAESTGYKVHFVVTRSVPTMESPADYAAEVFQDWGCGDDDVVIIASTKLAKAGIFAGEKAATLLTPEIAASIGSETFSFKAQDELFSTAVGDVTNRLISVMRGDADPGPPQIQRESGEGTFKSRVETGESKNKYVTVVVALLVASVVIPMVQYYWYVKDD